MVTHHGFVSKVVVTLLVSLASQAWADEFSGVRFSRPSGWETGERQGKRVLTPPDLNAGEILLAVVTGVQPATGASPAEQLAEVATALNDGVEVKWKSEVVITDRGAAGKLYIQNFDVVASDMGAHTRMVVLLVRGGQRAVAHILLSSASVLTEHQEDIQSFLSSLALTGAPVPAPASPSTTRPGAPTPAVVSPSSGKMPTGNTPGLYPGSPGWLPSGQGVKIPAARVVDGRPEGMWWHPQSRMNGKTASVTTLFLPDGTRASNPRPGGGDLFDLAGQRAQNGHTGVGTFQVADGKITQSYDGFTKTDTFRSGSDTEGPFLEIGKARHRPLSPPTAKGLVGTWATAGGKYVFRADGTFESGHITTTGAWVIAAGGQGTWQLDGYLLAIRPTGAPAWITTIGATGGSFIVIGTSLYNKE